MGAFWSGEIDGISGKAGRGGRKQAERNLYCSPANNTRLTCMSVGRDRYSLASEPQSVTYSTGLNPLREGRKGGGKPQ